MSTVARRGETQWIEEYEVQPNQKKAMTSVHDVRTVNSNLFSGSGIAGAILAA